MRALAVATASALARRLPDLPTVGDFVYQPGYEAKLVASASARP